MTNTAFVTTFPNNMFDVYAKRMLQSFVQFMPHEIPLLVQIDDDTLYPLVDKMLRPQDGICVGWEADHKSFTERNKGRDDPQDYRKQPVRFCHKVFAIKRALDAALKQKAADPSTAPRYLVWMDADVIITRPVTFEDIEKCLPNGGDAVAYLGRKEWPHSECGWLAFDLDSGADKIISHWVKRYIEDAIFGDEQWDDSWGFDVIRKNNPDYKCTNISPDAKGLDAWEASPMASWSTHYKGPQAKQQLLLQKPQMQQQRIQINTKNAIPHEEIRKHIEENQRLISRWIKPCHKHDEEIIMVSAGPLMIPEEVREACKGKKVVAVKHALEPLKRVGVKVWASILLDPRPHVADFIKEPDPSMLWFVASQVDPEVTRSLLDAGCTVWGYHASVGAEEAPLTSKQQYAVISGGSATATRGLFVLNHLGFHNFKLFGYDLCIPDKPNLSERDAMGQPKYMEMSVGFNDGLLGVKRCFWTEPQLIAQFEELNEIIKHDTFNLHAYGDGMIPFVLKSKRLAELRGRDLNAKLGADKTTYEELLWGFSPALPKWLPKILRRRRAASSS